MGKPTLSALADQLEQLQQRVDDLEQERDELRDELETERRRRREAERRVAELEDELESRAAIRWKGPAPSEITVEPTDAPNTYPLGNAVANAITEHDVKTSLGTDLDGLRDRLDDGDLADQTPDVPAAEEQKLVRTETALEDVVALPEHVAEDNMTENQRRARFLASDVEAYGLYNKGTGYIIRAGMVGRTLKAAGESAHPETVARVMDIFVELADGEADLVKSENEKKLVVPKDYVRRLNACREAHAPVDRAST